MKSIIREMREDDRAAVTEMMSVFYSSPALFTNGSEEIFARDIDACLSASPYIEGYVFEGEGSIQGYGMVAKSFSTEFGLPCIWIEDIYVKEEYRGCGIGSGFLAYIEQKYKDTILRLEVEEENKIATYVYKKAGFDVLPYVEMKKIVVI